MKIHNKVFFSKHKNLIISGNSHVFFLDFWNLGFKSFWTFGSSGMFPEAGFSFQVGPQALSFFYQTGLAAPPNPVINETINGGNESSMVQDLSLLRCHTVLGPRRGLKPQPSSCSLTGIRWSGNAIPWYFQRFLKMISLPRKIFGLFKDLPSCISVAWALTWMTQILTRLSACANFY